MWNPDRKPSDYSHHHRERGASNHLNLSSEALRPGRFTLSGDYPYCSKVVRRLTLFTWFHDEVGVIFLYISGFQGQKMRIPLRMHALDCHMQPASFKRNQQFHAGRGSRKPWTLWDAFGICVMHRSVNMCKPKIKPQMPKNAKSWAIDGHRIPTSNSWSKGSGRCSRTGERSCRETATDWTSNPRSGPKNRVQCTALGMTWWRQPKQDSSSGTPLTIRDTNGKCKTIKKTTARSKTKKKSEAKKHC